ncbi:hypothetical protein H9Y04_24625 [Streptomyces sp. TRM66268-LWL]|uniref:Uncharacterized protein n=1 Tax=Streptomyces polyasparticus TaxID=2767826 RepID=A0ABR7SJT7_9ACTN|nr:hypothetical protein [Streptomyces polyasparticus]MBC9715732.1 hypothetical protein [Streptomyces polyasparticus]
MCLGAGLRCRLDLGRGVSAAPAARTDAERPIECPHDLDVVVGDVTRNLQDATDAHRHAADVLARHFAQFVAWLAEMVAKDVCAAERRADAIRLRLLRGTGRR